MSIKYKILRISQIDIQRKKEDEHSFSLPFSSPVIGIFPKEIRIYIKLL